MTAKDLSARPLGLAEVIDRSVAVALRHFRALFAAMLLAEAPALLLSRRLAPAQDLLEVLGDPAHGAELLGPALWRLSLLFVSLLALQLLATGAAAAIVAPSLEPRRAAARPGPARAVLSVTTAVAVQVLLLAGAPVAGGLPGLALALRARSLPTLLAGAVGAMVGGLGLFLVATLRSVFVPVVAVLEGRVGLAALGRSSRLMSPRPGSPFAERPGVRASLVLLVLFVLLAAVNGLAGIPRLVALRASGASGGLGLVGAELSAPLEVGLTLFEAAAAALLQPFSLVAVVVLYFDRRARTEGIDLEAWAERL